MEPENTEICPICHDPFKNLGSHMKKHQPKEETAPSEETIRVRAKKLGWYDEVRRRPGDVFTLKPRLITKRKIDPKTHAQQIVYDKEGQPVMEPLSARQQFSSLWMERVDAEETPLIGAQAALNAAQDELRGSRAPVRV